MLLHSPESSHPSSSLALRFASTSTSQRSGTARVLQGVSQQPDIFIHPFKGPIHMQILQVV
jgi:hypothetical protein